MKSILMSIQPKWCELIASGKKTIEVRKTKPKLATPFKVYIYETQGRTETPWIDEDGHHIFKGRGQVIGEFICRNIDIIDMIYSENLRQANSEINRILQDSCLSGYELLCYLNRDTVDRDGYAYNISDLVIYDKPKELGEFHKCGAVPLEKLEEELCSYCSATGHGEYATSITPNGPIFCEGRFCKDAYEEYLDENFALTRPPQSWCYVEENSL